MFLKVMALYMTAGFVNAYAVKKAAMRRALSLVTEKGIINIGSGCSRTSTSNEICQLPEVVVNVDHAIYDGCPSCFQADLETGSLPFGDKEFDIAFASHVLEHLNNWQEALDEWSRIADTVIIVLPNPMLDMTMYFHPDHKRNFSFADMTYIRENWPTALLFV